MPGWDYLETRRLRASCSTKDRLRHYWTILVLHFALTAFSVWMLGGAVLNAGGALDVARTSIASAWLFYTLFGLSVLFGLLGLTPLIQGLIKPKARIAYTKAVGKTSFGFMFPRARSERYTFAALSVSAGVCEEIIFRSYFLAYFMSPPFGWSPFVALLASSLLFGVNHSYQGPVGILKTGVGGFLFGLFYFTTGSLVAAMVLHAIIDLSALYMFRPDLLPTPAEGDCAPAAA